MRGETPYARPTCRMPAEFQIAESALAFRGYNVTNLGRTPELLAVPAYRAIVREELDRTLEAWCKLRKEDRAMEQMVDRFVSDERRQAERVEQRHADDSSGTRTVGRGPVE